MGNANDEVDKSTTYDTYDVVDGGQREDVQEQSTESNMEHEREAGWGDYFRVFSYAKKWDFALMAAAAVAALGAGVVSLSKRLLKYRCQRFSG